MIALKSFIGFEKSDLSHHLTSATKYKVNLILFIQHNPSDIATKGQLNTEWIYEVIVSPKMSTENSENFCPGGLLEGRAEILQIFGWHFGRNDDLIKFLFSKKATKIDKIFTVDLTLTI